MIWLSQSERDALIYVTSDLQADKDPFAIPRNAVKQPDNGSSFVIGGESLVIVSIQGCLIGAGAVGFTLNQVFDGTTTPVWKESIQAAGQLSFDHQMYRPLSGPVMVYPAFTVKNAAKMTLVRTGAPGVGSWLQVCLALNMDETRKGKRTALGTNYDGNSTS